ncbi:MAG TPA: hypothetical protein VGS80_04680, partial [Ktedonobacterales bacterium]|nr:hypothetical protein [Ktedonobacterales bacterium]
PGVRAGLWQGPDGASIGSRSGALVDEPRREIRLLEQDAAKSHTRLAGSLTDIEASRVMLERHMRDEEAWARR